MRLLGQSYQKWFLTLHRDWSNKTKEATMEVSQNLRRNRYEILIYEQLRYILRVQIDRNRNTMSIAVSARTRWWSWQIDTVEFAKYWEKSRNAKHKLIRVHRRGDDERVESHERATLLDEGVGFPSVIAIGAGFTSFKKK